MDPVRAAVSKEASLRAWLRDRGPVLVGYSGGVDSTFLAAIARHELGRDGLLAVLGQSASVPGQQARDAVALAHALDIPLRLAPTDEMADPRYAANPVNRCYFCKTVLWTVLVPMARTLGYRTVVDGTNADDLREYRPGAAAAREHGVESPLALAGLAKDDIRALSRERGLPTWSQPSAPCLASRIPYGMPVTVQRLGQVERAEQALRALGITGNLRVRHHGDLARVELEPAEVETWLQPDRATVLAGAVRDAGFDRVALDLRGFRSGSLNVLDGVVAA